MIIIPCFRSKNTRYYRHSKYFLLFFLVIGGALSGCGQKVKQQQVTDSLTKEWNQTIPGNFSGQSEAVFDSTQINRFLKSYPVFNTYADEINNFYKRRKYAYAWFENGKLIEQAGNLSNRILNLQNEGIDQVVPYQKTLDSLISNINPQRPDVQAELMLTAQYFAFSKLAWQGMSNAVSQSARWYLPRKKVDYEQYLDSLLKEPAKKTALAEPVYRQYELLRNYLKKYRDLDAQGNWPPIVLSAKIKQGDTSVMIPAIKKRLYQLEDFHSDALNNTFNDELMAAVKHFQNRHGLSASGLLNKETLAELNIPLKSRIEQLIVNMERSRWLPVRLNADYLAVNIPEFKLHVYHADSLLWSCNVVVGQTVHQTTIFYGEIRYVVFSPYWEVPPSIVRKEIVPEMKKHPDYLADHQMQVNGYLEGLPVVRQLPGPKNSLGLVKFLFPNSYNIYLHDTPSKSLFGETARAFSHGCIRVQEPAKLAGFLLKDQQNWTPEKIDQAMHAGKEQYVTLQKKVPVFIAYFTAFIDREHQLNFRKDIYRLDGPLAAMLLSGKGDQEKQR
jgi:murein L,D-transpeptidase YcbB/YkuD